MLVTTCDGKCSLLCVIAHGTGIDDDNIRVFLFVGFFVAHCLQHTRNALAVGFILLTAVSDDTRLFHISCGDDGSDFIRIFNL